MVKLSISKYSYWIETCEKWNKQDTIIMFKKIMNWPCGSNVVIKIRMKNSTKTNEIEIYGSKLIPENKCIIQYTLK